LYTSETRALATVEFLVHVFLPFAPIDLSVATIEVPDDVTREVIEPSGLPHNWCNYPAPLVLADLGTSWAKSNRSLLLRVPSAVVQHEYNVLINPEHPDMARVVIVGVEYYAPDERLFRSEK
jgi:RES domain-containing protein